jgi:hypothetical protein
MTNYNDKHITEQTIRLVSTLDPMKWKPVSKFLYFFYFCR